MKSMAEDPIKKYCLDLIEWAEDHWQVIPVYRTRDAKIVPIPLAADLVVQKDRREQRPRDRRSFSSPQEAITQELGEGAEVVLVTGEPGAGKTVTALWSARFFAQLVLDRMPDMGRQTLEQGRTPDVLLPVYLDLGEWKTIYADEKSLAELLAKIEKKRLPDRNHQCLWLLDGLDLVTETWPQSVDAVISDAHDLANDCGTRFVIFSRPFGEKEERAPIVKDKKRRIELNPLRAEERMKWVHDHYPEAESALAEFEARHPEHRSFLDVPLLFAMALSACLQEKEKFTCDFYPGRAGLFQGFLSYALRRAEEDKRISSVEKIDFETRHFHTLAGVFWAALYAGHEHRLPRAQIKEFMEKAFGDKAGDLQSSWDQAASILQRAGLLLDLPSESAWGVLHQQFAEFFAAFHLAQRLKSAAKGDWFQLELWDHLKVMRLDPVTTQALAILSTLSDINPKDLLTRAFNTLKPVSLEHALELLAATGTDIGWDFFIEASRNKETRYEAIWILGVLHDHRAIAPLIEALKDKAADAVERSCAAYALGAINDPGAVALLIKALKDPEPDVRGSAATALGDIKNPVAVVPLIETLKDPEPEVRAFAAEALGRIKNRRAVAHLIEALKDTEPEVRMRAADALGEIKDPGAVAHLIEALKDSEPEVRMKAADALGEIKDPGAVAHLIEALKDTEPDEREFAADALGEIKDPGAMAPLIEALKDSEPDVRGSAAIALGEIKDSRAVSPLIEALKDPEPSVRSNANLALCKINDRWDVEILVEDLKATQVVVRRKAIQLLAKIKDLGTVESILEATKDTDPVVSEIAAKALGEIMGAASVEHFIEDLNNIDKLVRLRAVRIMGHLGHQEATDSLIQALNDQEEVVRLRAVQALGIIKDRKAVGPILKCLKKDLPKGRNRYVCIISISNIIKAELFSIEELAQKTREMEIDYEIVLEIALRSNFRLAPWSMDGELEEQRKRRERMAEASSGKGTKMVYNFHDSIVNINSNLKDTVQTINMGGMGGADKEELRRAVEALSRELEAALGREATPEQAEKAKEAAELTKGLVEEAAAASPNRSLLKVSAQGLKEAAQALAGIAPTVLPLAMQVAETVLRSAGG